MKVEKIVDLSLIVGFFLLLTNITVVVAADDSNNREIGIEWVNQYHGTAPDLTFCDDDAVGFYNHLGSTGFTRRFNFGDDLAWESDFERTGVGGHDDIYVDTLDFAYFSGHGSPDGFYFGTNYDGDGNFPFMVHSGPGSPQTYEAQWGDIDLEWIFISACQVLYENGIWDRLWYVFNGLHGVTGFHTVEADTPDLGRFFAYYLTDTWGPYCIGDA